jgi:peptidoglycan/xylan/chitin deacetylase (PgdA/CDA1 family)
MPRPFPDDGAHHPIRAPQPPGGRRRGARAQRPGRAAAPRARLERARARQHHRIGDPGETPFDRALWTASAEDLDAQVRFLVRNFDVVGPDDVADLGPGRHVLITFDDGYRDNHTLALPILREHGATAAFFLTTDFLDVPGLAWWDEIAWMVRTSPRASLVLDGAAVRFDEPDRTAAVSALVDRAKALPGRALGPYLDRVAEATGSGRAPCMVADGQWMTWRMARELLAAGMHVGGHTVTHPILARLEPDLQRREILGCRERLQAELGIPMRWFSYPNGDRGSFDAHTRAALADAGVELAFSFDGGYRPAGAFDPYDVPRIAAGPGTGADLLAAAVTLPQVFTRRRA